MTGFSFAQTSYTFTTVGQTGAAGPDQAMIDAAYAGTSLNGNMDGIVLIDALGRSVDVKYDLTSCEVDGSSLAPDKYIFTVTIE